MARHVLSKSYARDYRDLKPTYRKFPTPYVHTANTTASCGFAASKNAIAHSPSFPAPFPSYGFRNTDDEAPE
jgi:hypothetical protein